MTGEQDPRRPLDPVIAGLADGKDAGFEALEFVTQGLREGLRRQAGRPARASDDAVPTRGTGRSGARRTPAGELRPTIQAGRQGQLLGNVLGIIEGFLGVAGSMTRALAELNAARDDGPTERDDDPTPAAAAAAGEPFRLRMRTAAGTNASGDFVVWNTGGSTLSTVTFNATGLVAAGGSIDASTVGFSPAAVQIGPGRSAPVTVTVSVPAATVPGQYHGCVQPTVAGPWVVVDLEVTPAAPA